MGKLKKAKKTKQKNRSPEQAFNEALERLSRFQRQNEKFRVELDALVKRILPQIEDAEVERLEAEKALALKLTSFISKKSLPQYLRAELLDWIQSILYFMKNSPFSHKCDTLAVEDEIVQQIMKHGEHEEQKLIKKLKSQGRSEEEIGEIQSIFTQMRDPEGLEELAEDFQDTLFEDDELEQQDLFGDEDLFGEDDSMFEEEFNKWQEEALLQEENSERELQRLLKGTSINKLFRRIARKLHPDLEQDPTKKQEKHTQMSALIEARDNKDIAYIMSLYTETFGSLPEDFPKSDYPKLTKIINKKITELREEKDIILHENPHSAMIYECFNGKKEKQNLIEYKQELKHFSVSYRALTQDLSSIPALREHLNNRAQAIMHQEEEYSTDY